MWCQSLCSRELCLLSFWRRGWAPSSLILSCPAVVEALGVLEPRASPVPWRDGSLSDLSLTGEEPVPGGSPGDSGLALSTQSTEALERLSGRVPKAGGRQEEAGTPRRGLGARLQQLLTPSRRSPASRIPPPELPPDLPPPARRSPMDSFLRPRERPGSTASEVASQGGPDASAPGGLGRGAANVACQRVKGLLKPASQWRGARGRLTILSHVTAELSLSGQ